MQTIMTFLESIKFGPAYGDWSSAIVAIVFGIISFIGMGASFLFFVYRYQREQKEMQEQQKRMIKADEDQNFIELHKYYDELWDKVGIFGKRVLHSNYKNTKELKEIVGGQDNVDKLKDNIFQLIKLFSNVEFIYCNKQDTAHWKRWHFVLEFVFKKHKLIYTAFVHNKEEFRKSNHSFVEYVELMMKDSTSEDVLDKNPKVQEHLDNKESKEKAS